MDTSSFKLPLKPGHTSTEFWLTIAVSLLTGLMSALSLLDVTWTAMVIAGLTIAYNSGRSKLKTIQAETEAHVVKSAADVAAAQAMVSTEAAPPPPPRAT